MARRKSRRKATKRRRSAKINLLNTAEALVLGGAFTQGVFGTALLPFLGEGWLMPITSASNNSWELTLNKLVRGAVPGGQDYGFHVGQGYTVAGMVEKNLRNGGLRMLGTMIIVPIAFKGIKNLTRKPRSAANRMLKAGSIPITV